MPVKRSHLATVFLLVLTVACNSREQTAARLPTLTGTIDLEIGSDVGDAPYLFGRISGVAGDAEGRIFVADAQAHEIRAFDADGSFVFATGRQGQGPGEFVTPCCLAFGPRGRLWVRDVGNNRYQAFAVDADRFVLDANIAKQHASGNLSATLTFDDDGNLVDVIARAIPGATTTSFVRLYLTPDGEVVGEDVLVEPDPGELGMHTVTTGSGGNAVTRFVYQPFGPMSLTAHGPDRWAQAVSSRYEITVHRRGAEPLAIARGIEAAVALSPAEIERAEERMARDREWTGGALPYGIPDHKQPLRSLFFDHDRNLWVERTVADGADRQADVFDRDGNLVGHRVWPSGVRFGSSAWVSADVALGTGIDAEGVNKVFRLRFR